MFDVSHQTHCKLESYPVAQNWNLLKSLFSCLKKYSIFTWSAAAPATPAELLQNDKKLS